MFFSLSIIFTLHYLRYLPYHASAPPTTIMTMTLPPPRPKPCQNMMRTQVASAKNISADSWGQCALIRRNGQKKGTSFTKKHTFCPRARQSAACRIIVNKIKKHLVSCKKIASPCCGGRDRSRDVRRSHSPVKLKPLEAGGRRSWFRCFLEVAGAVCCGCVLWEVFNIPYDTT